MTRLSFEQYLDHLRRESRRFRDVLADCDPGAKVPACPDWDAADLLWHLAEVQWFWSSIIVGRPAGPDALEEPARPTSYDGLLADFDTYSAALVSALESADPTEVAWSWAPEQTVGFTFRRQAHEALVHRLDAEQTAGVVTALDPALATDGVAETLGVMFGGCPDWGTFTPDQQHLRVDCTDTDTSIWVQLGQFTGTDPDDGVAYDEPDLAVVPDPGGQPDAVVAGPAGVLDAWLWRRDDGAGVTTDGDPATYARFRALVDNPIN